MRQLGLAFVSATVLAGWCQSVEASELRAASLAGLSRLSAVIVTAATDTVSEVAVRDAVERRLSRAKIAVDGEPGPELLVSVVAERDRAEHCRCAHATFHVRVSLRESVVLDRATEQGSVSAVTWSTSGTIQRFSLKAPELGILDMVDSGVSAFLREVASDTQQAGPDRER